jgi:regulator of ribonuclease activity A
LASAAVKNGWQGIIVDGAVRDVAEIAPLSIGVLALALHPLRAIKRNTGVRDISIMLQGVRVNPLDWIYADADGVLVSAQPLL